jgi:hypothetical protein
MPPISKMSKATTTNSHWILFLLMPFVAFVLAIKNFRSSWAKNIVWAFIVFYGMTFAIGEENKLADISRYVIEVQNMYTKNPGFTTIVKLFKDNEDVDIAKLIIATAVSSFTNSQQVLIAIYGFIFGFFFSRNIWFVIERLKGEVKFSTIILLVAFFLTNPFWNISGFRFFTALHVFIYGLLPYLFEGKRKGILISALSILFHFSFVLPLSVLFIYIILGNRLNVYFAFFILSVFVASIDLKAFNEVVENYAPEILLKRTSSYRNEEVAENTKEAGVANDQPKTNWYIVWYETLFHWSIILYLVVLFVRCRKTIQKYKGLLSCFCFTLLFWGVTNTLSSLPSMSRFIHVGVLLALPLIIFCLQLDDLKKILQKLILVTTPAFVLFIVVSIRVGFLSLSVNTIFSNPLLAALMDDNIPLNELIK